MNEHDVVYPLKVVETFNIHAGEWRDFVCVWERTNELTSEILVPQTIKNYIGPTEQFTRKYFPTGKKC